MTWSRLGGWHPCCLEGPSVASEVGWTAPCWGLITAPQVQAACPASYWAEAWGQGLAIEAGQLISLVIGQKLEKWVVQAGGDLSKSASRDE